MRTNDYDEAARIIKRGGGAEAKLKAVMWTVECVALINAKKGLGTRIIFEGHTVSTETIPGPPHIEYEFKEAHEED